MNAVGIDVSKGKSMMMALQPMNQVVLKPREYPHTEAGLDQMAHDILRACLISQRVRIGVGIFRQSRREAEGILGVLRG